MLDRIDKLSKRHAEAIVPKTDSLKANKAIHVAGMGGFATLGAAFLKYSSDPTVGIAFGIVSLVGFIALVLTGWHCLTNHKSL